MQTKNKGGRPAKPTPNWNPEKGVWQVRVTLPKPEDWPPDAEAPRRTVDLPGVPQDDEPRAQRVALIVSESLRNGEASPVGSDQTVTQWFTLYYDAAARGEVGRKNRGAPQVSVADRRARFMRWIAPHIGAQPMARIKPDALRPVVRALDAQIRKRAAFYELPEDERQEHEGTKPGLSEKTVRNVWGELTAGFREACTSKLDDLRVLSDDPTRSVQPPASADERQQAALFPSELHALLAASSDQIPVYRRALYAVAAYTGLRVGELRGLTADDVDLEHGLVYVRRQNRGGKGSARTKTRAGRRQVPIEANLVALLEALLERASGDETLLRVPPPEDCAELVRRDLIAAGCDREDLFADDAERAHFTFHGLRHTCLTHWAIRGEPWLLKAAGHLDPATSTRYIDDALVMRANFGEPHAPLPPELVREVSAGFGVWKPKPGGNSAEPLRPQRELNPCYRRERPVS